MFSFYEIWREDKAQLPILFIKFVNFHLRIRTGCIFRLNNVESCPNIYIILNMLKRFYTRKTKTSLDCIFEKMTFIVPFLSMELK